LQQIEVTESKRTLGVWQAACGDETVQKTILIKKIEDWGEETSTKAITKHRVNHQISPGSNSTQQSRMHKKSKSTQKGNYRQDGNSPYGTKCSSQRPNPVRRNGTPYQTIDHVLTILQHGHSETVTGNLLRTSLEYMALESGMPGDPMNLPIHDISWISEKTWMDSTLRAMDGMGISIETNMTGLKKWTNNDSFLWKGHRVSSMERKLQFSTK